jgi:hypothetical protein
MRGPVRQDAGGGVVPDLSSTRSLDDAGDLLDMTRGGLLGAGCLDPPTLRAEMLVTFRHFKAPASQDRPDRDLFLGGWRALYLISGVRGYKVCPPRARFDASYVG